MVVGIDTYGKAGPKGNQVYAMVATVDLNFANYWSKASFSSEEKTLGDFI